MPANDAQQCGTDIFEAVSKIFSPVSRHKDHATSVLPNKRKSFRQGRAAVRRSINPPSHVQQSIDHGVAGHMDRRFVDAFSNEVHSGLGCRGEMISRRKGCHAPVHFFRPRGIERSRSQTSLHMTNRNLAIKCRQRSGERRSGVAMDQNDIRFLGIQDAAHSCQYPRRELIQSLARLHYVEIKISRNFK